MRLSIIVHIGEPEALSSLIDLRLKLVFDVGVLNISSLIRQNHGINSCYKFEQSFVRNNKKKLSPLVSLAVLSGGSC